MSFSSFVDYKRSVLTLSADLKRLRDFSEKLALENSIKLIDSVLKRIEDDSFSVAVVGEFKRGKSTFINALLGQEILPADILPCSATLNRVTYGLKPQVKVIYKNGREEDVAIDRLAEYVTKLTPESEITAADVKEAVIYYPVHYCQNNVDIIDTPGLNDDRNMTDVTLSVLPQVDVALLIIMAQSPLSEYERDFLENKLLTNDLGRVIFVVTGIDRFNHPEDGEKVVANIRDRIENFVLQKAEKQFGKDSEEYKVYVKKIGTPKIFGLSAYQALAAKRTGDNALLHQSRFPEFETALEKFLTQERGAIALQVPINRAIVSATEIIKTINIQEGAQQMSQEDFDTSYDASTAKLAALRQRKVEEMQKIDAATTQTKQAVAPLLSQLEHELKQAAIQVIKSEVINPADLEKSKIDGFQEKLGQKISNAMRITSQNIAEKIQSEVDKKITIEVERLGDFALVANEISYDIEKQFLLTTHQTSQEKIEANNMMPSSTLSVTQLAGIGLGGALTANMALVFAFGMVFTLIPTLIIGAVSAIGFKHFFKQSGTKTLENFKIKYEEAVVEEIEKQLALNPPYQKVNDSISEIFNTIKQKISQEAETLLQNMQNTLNDLRGKKERNETLNESKLEEFKQIRIESQKILDNAHNVSDKIMQAIGV